MDNLTKRSLKAKAHGLKPIITMGFKGLTPAVQEEIEGALLAHELIKIKLTKLEKFERLELAKEICEQLNAEEVQLIGNILTVFKKNYTK